MRMGMMKITSFRIYNFRSIADTDEINCKNLMVFIGRNNAGKSNILKALDIFFNSSKPDVADIPYFAQEGDQIEISVSFGRIASEIKKRLDIDEDILTYSKSFNITKDGKSYKLSSPKELLNGEDLKSYKASFSGITELRSFLKQHLPKYYYVPALRNLADESKFKRGSLIQDLLLPLLDDRIATDDQSIQSNLQSIESILKERSKIIETEISDILRHRVDDFERLSFDMSNIELKKALSPDVLVKTTASDSLLSALLQGAGTQNFLILALAQYYASGQTPVDLVIAFEEPEISLHSTAQRNMLDLIFQILTNERQQIFLTTHSTIFIDRTCDNVCLVEKSDGKTLLTVPQRSREIITQLGIRGSDYLNSDALVFVEGLCDYEVFTLWADAKPPPVWKRYLFTFVPLGGLPSIEKFRAEDCLNLCNHVYAILDSDKSAEDDKFKRRAKGIVQKITTELDGLVKILRRRELENYFSEQAVIEVFPEAKDVVQSELFMDTYAPLKDHLTEIIRVQHHADNKDRPDYNEELTKRKYYNPYYASLIAQKMIELEDVPKEFITILEEFARDLSRKLPKF